MSDYISIKKHTDGTYRASVFFHDICTRSTKKPSKALAVLEALYGMQAQKPTLTLMLLGHLEVRDEVVRKGKPTAEELYAQLDKDTRGPDGESVLIPFEKWVEDIISWEGSQKNCPDVLEACIEYRKKTAP